MSLLTTGRSLPNPDGTFLPAGKKSILCYGLSLQTPETTLGLLDQFQIQFVDEQLQCGIAPYHLLEYLALCRDGQKEVRYVQTAAALFVGGQAFQHIGYNHPFANAGQQGGFLPPSLRCPQIGNESYLPVPKNGHCLPIEAAILPARCQPNVIRYEVAHDDRGLLALDQHHRRRGGAVQQVFAEETLPEMEVRQTQLRMDPTDIRPWLLYPMPGSGIVLHDFPGPYLSLPVRLPEDGRAAPFGRGADAVQLEQTQGLFLAECLAEVAIQGVDLIVRQAPPDHIG